MTLKVIIFEINIYGICIANKIIDGRQFTLV